MLLFGFVAQLVEAILAVLQCLVVSLLLFLLIAAKRFQLLLAFGQAGVALGDGAALFGQLLLLLSQFGLQLLGTFLVLQLGLLQLGLQLVQALLQLLGRGVGQLQLRLGLILLARELGAPGFQVLAFLAELLLVFLQLDARLLELGLFLGESGFGFAELVNLLIQFQLQTGQRLVALFQLVGAFVLSGLASIQLLAMGIQFVAFGIQLTDGISMCALLLLQARQFACRRHPALAGAGQLLVQVLITLLEFGLGLLQLFGFGLALLSLLLELLQLLLQLRVFRGDLVAFGEGGLDLLASVLPGQVEIGLQLVALFAGLLQLRLDLVQLLLEVLLAVGGLLVVVIQLGVQPFAFGTQVLGFFITGLAELTGMRQVGFQAVVALAFSVAFGADGGQFLVLCVQFGLQSIEFLAALCQLVANLLQFLVAIAQVTGLAGQLPFQLLQAFLLGGLGMESFGGLGGGLFLLAQGPLGFDQLFLQFTVASEQFLDPFLQVGDGFQLRLFAFGSGVTLMGQCVQLLLLAGQVLLDLFALGLSLGQLLLQRFGIVALVLPELFQLAIAFSQGFDVPFTFGFGIGELLSDHGQIGVAFVQLPPELLQFVFAFGG